MTKDNKTQVAADARLMIRECADDPRYAMAVRYARYALAQASRRGPVDVAAARHDMEEAEHYAARAEVAR